MPVAFDFNHRGSAIQFYNLALNEIRLSDEVGHKAVIGGIKEFARRAGLGDGCVAHHHNLVGNRERLFLIVGDVDHGQAEFLLYRADVFTNLPAQLGIEIRKRLVKEQYLRLEHQGTRHRHPLLLATRQLGRQAPVETLQAHQIQPLQRARTGFPLFETREGQAIHDVFQHAHMWKERVGLENHRHVAVGGRQLRDIHVANGYSARSSHLQPRNHP